MTDLFAFLDNSFISSLDECVFIVVSPQQVRHPSTGQVMVLKQNMKATGTKTMREVELLRKLSHPNIVQ